MMRKHRCLLCMGSNADHLNRLSYAQVALSTAFPDIRFGKLMETEAIGSGFLSPFSNQLAYFTTPLSADAVRACFKGIELACGRLPQDKANGIVKLDIDLLTYDDAILKPEDMQRTYIRQGLISLGLTNLF